MKKLYFLLSSIVLLTAFTVLGNLSDVVNGIKAGNASIIAKYFDNTVEITLPTKTNNYSKTQAETVLRDFFGSNKVKSFAIVHQGESGGSQFCIGTLITSAGTFRTTINLKTKGDKQVLQEIKFEN